MNDIRQFQGEVQQNIQSLTQDKNLQSLSCIWLYEVTVHKYHYNFAWMGLPIIQCPQDVLTMQQLTWEVGPGLIIKTGIAYGGSLIFYASMLELLAQSGHGGGTILGIDIDIRQHNREAIEAYPMTQRVQMLQGSSIDPGIIERVKRIAAGKRRMPVALDSNHTHDHVLAELETYVPLTSVGSYCIVLDTATKDMPQAMFNDRPRDVGNNLKTAVHAYLRDHPEFVIDADIHHKFFIAVAPDGYLRRVA